VNPYTFEDHLVHCILYTISVKYRQERSSDSFNNFDKFLVCKVCKEKMACIFVVNKYSLVLNNSTLVLNNSTLVVDKFTTVLNNSTLEVNKFTKAPHNFVVVVHRFTVVAYKPTKQIDVGCNSYNLSI